MRLMYSKTEYVPCRTLASGELEFLSRFQMVATTDFHAARKFSEFTSAVGSVRYHNACRKEGDPEWTLRILTTTAELSGEIPE